MLPIVGVDIDGVEKVLKILKKLQINNIAEYYYSPYSLLEILGKISKTRYDRNRFKLGLIAIQEKFNSVLPTIEGYIKALEYKTRGFKDLIDLLLFTTAQSNNILFLTRDQKLIDFLSTQNEDLSTILPEDILVSKYENIIA